MIRNTRVEAADPTSPEFTNLATWQVLDQGGRRTVRLRLPWALLGLADPSSRTALGPGIPAEPVSIDGLRLRFRAEGSTFDTSYSWPTWNHIGYTERPKAGQSILRDAYRDLAEYAGLARVEEASGGRLPEPAA